MLSFFYEEVVGWQTYNRNFLEHSARAVNVFLRMELHM